jgi:hypothetical protein
MPPPELVEPLPEDVPLPEDDPLLPDPVVLPPDVLPPDVLPPDPVVLPPEVLPPDEVPLPVDPVAGGAELGVPEEVDVAPGDVGEVVLLMLGCELPPHAVKYASVHNAVMRSEPLKTTSFITTWPREIELGERVLAWMGATRAGVSAVG